MLDPILLGLPWSSCEVDALNAYQVCRDPYVCRAEGCCTPLVATLDGWVCLMCGERSRRATLTSLSEGIMILDEQAQETQTKGIGV